MNWVEGEFIRYRNSKKAGWSVPVLITHVDDAVPQNIEGVSLTGVRIKINTESCIEAVRPQTTDKECLRKMARLLEKIEKAEQNYREKESLLRQTLDQKRQEFEKERLMCLQKTSLADDMTKDEFCKQLQSLLEPRFVGQKANIKVRFIRQCGSLILQLDQENVIPVSVKKSQEFRSLIEKYGPDLQPQSKPELQELLRIYGAEADPLLANSGETTQTLIYAYKIDRFVCRRRYNIALVFGFSHKEIKRLKAAIDAEKGELCFF